MSTLKSVAAVVAVCLFPATALAQEVAEREMLKQHCTGDYLTHCGEYAPDTPEVKACFRAKTKLLSVNCAAAIAYYQKKPSPIRNVSAAR